MDNIFLYFPSLSIPVKECDVLQKVNFYDLSRKILSPVSQFHLLTKGA